MNILLTGGAGYIGSHTALALIESGHEVVIVDDFSNSSPEVINRLAELTARPVQCHQLDIADREALSRVCRAESIEAVIHFAGLKAVGESVKEPLRYYEVNISTTLSLCSVMLELGIRNLVFSSSATVYGEPERIPLDENCRTGGASSPYGSTKLFIEQILADIQRAHPQMNIARLRYFNPAGAHASARLGEDPQGRPNNLVPVLSQVAVGKLEQLIVHGDDYDTPDGSCVRDYIHVCDLAAGHLAALAGLGSDPGLVTYNLGTGKGHSVKEVVAVFEEVAGVTLNKRTGPRRPGDVATTYCDPTLARQEMGWQAQYSIADICRDAWRWQQQNPDGYRPDD